MLNIERQGSGFLYIVILSFTSINNDTDESTIYTNAYIINETQLISFLQCLSHTSTYSI